MYRIAFLPLVSLLIVGWVNVASAQSQRIALVVGNANYATIGTLDNPVNDAELIGGTLEAAGFAVDYLIDANQTQLEAAVVALGRKLRDAGPEAVGVFYYAGHGVQSDGKNYLIPVDAALGDEAELEIVGLQADLILRQMGTAQNATNVVILDSCRNNPFAEVQGLDANGLAKMTPRPGTFLSYATGPGDVAFDGLDGHSPFSAALADAMRVPDRPIEEVFREVRIRVVEETRGIQTPWETSLLTRAFSFFPATVDTPVSDAEADRWAQVGTSPDPQALVAFLRSFPQGRFAPEARRDLERLLAEAEVPGPDSAQRGLSLVGGQPSDLERDLMRAALFQAMRRTTARCSMPFRAAFMRHGRSWNWKRGNSRISACPAAPNGTEESGGPIRKLTGLHNRSGWFRRAPSPFCRLPLRPYRQ